MVTLMGKNVRQVVQGPAAFRSSLGILSHRTNGVNSRIQRPNWRRKSGISAEVSRFLCFYHVLNSLCMLDVMNAIRNMHTLDTNHLFPATRWRASGLCLVSRVEVFQDHVLNLFPQLIMFKPLRSGSITNKPVFIHGLSSICSGFHRNEIHHIHIRICIRVRIQYT